MTTHTYERIIRKLACASAIAYLTFAFVFCAPAAIKAEAKPRPKLKCYVRCCPIAIGCEITVGDGTQFQASTRQRAPNSEMTIKDGRLIIELRSPGEQNPYVINAETKLDPKTAQSLGFQDVTLLPGRYPLVPMKGGMARVSIKVRTVQENSKTTGRN